MLDLLNTKLDQVRTLHCDKANWRIANLDLIWNVQDLDLRIKGSSLAESCVLLVDHHVTRAGHVVLVQALDVQANVVTWTCKVHTLVVHLHCEHLACARIGGCVGWQEDHFLVWLHQALLNTASQDIADTLNLVDTITDKKTFTAVSFTLTISNLATLIY